MALRVGDEDVLLKVPKTLRHALSDELSRGDQITVDGQIDFDLESGREKQVVTQVRRMGQQACITCPIRVCAKKNCWRAGGKEVFHALKRRLAEAGLEDEVKLKTVNCLDQCKRAPNVECGHRIHHRCTPQDVERILAPWLESAGKKFRGDGLLANR
ncbi:MAG: (2Fe-2S) ferredoxin domain-containing protein [Chthoniobacteraceae bacterium]